MSAKTILLVDDSRVARMMTRRLVEVLCPGWTIVEAANGNEALDAFAKHRPDFTILDVNMPGIDGLEVAKLIKDGAPDAVITLLTANIQDSIRDQAAGLHVGFMSKPVRETDLVQFLKG